MTENESYIPEVCYCATPTLTGKFLDRSKYDIRQRKKSNGCEVAAVQCLQCGRQIREVSKASVLWYELPTWDETLAPAWSEKIKKLWEMRREQRLMEQDERRTERFRELSERYARADWKDYQNRVMSRCKRVCEGCGCRPAVHVHHLTYERLGNEMLFDLVGVCVECHETIHGRKFTSNGQH